MQELGFTAGCLADRENFWLMYTSLKEINPVDMLPNGNVYDLEKHCIELSQLASSRNGLTILAGLPICLVIPKSSSAAIKCDVFD